MNITFYKYQGTGNDFILLDNRNGDYDALAENQIMKICDRRFGIGADGLILLVDKKGYDFEMVYFNADGKSSTMCGNGGRCMVKFANNIGIHNYTYHFLATDGPHEAEVDNTGVIRLKMQDIMEVQEYGSHTVLNTGSPHFVKFVSNLENIDVVNTGRDIRNSKLYKAEGINVNFVETLGEDMIFVRTYERGVEDETLSCGTGVTAAAIVSAHNDKGFNRVEVKTTGGNLSVEFNKIDDHHFDNVWLCGHAEFVYKGEIEIN